MSYLDGLIFGVRDLYAAGVALTRRSKQNFAGGLVGIDDPTNGWTSVQLGGAPLANASTGTLSGVATVDALGLPVGAVRFSGVAPSVQGFAGGTTGRRLVVLATGGPLVLVNQTGGVDATQRIITGTGADVTIANGAGAELVYDATTARWRLTGDGGAGGAGSVPTGTGIPHIVAGVQDAAASLIVNADVNAAAAIAGSKVAPAFGAQNITTSGYISLHATPATSGAIRLGGAAAATQIGWDDGSATTHSLIATEAGGNGLVFGNLANAMNLWGSSLSLYSASGASFLYGGGAERLRIEGSGISIGGGSGDYGSGDKVAFLINAATVPTVTPTGGGILFAQGGACKWYGTSGTVTTMAPAEPHCPKCGSDVGISQTENDLFGEELLTCKACELRTGDGVIRHIADFFERKAS